MLLSSLLRNELESRESSLAHSWSAPEFSPLWEISYGKEPSNKIGESLSSFLTKNESEETNNVGSYVKVSKSELFTNKEILSLKEFIQNSHSHQQIIMSLLSLSRVKGEVSKDGDNKGHKEGFKLSGREVEPLVDLSLLESVLTIES